jgi:flagellar biosynthesis protein
MANSPSPPIRRGLKAVALSYEMSSAAPKVTGQGEGYVAQAILDKAKEMGIPTRVEPELVEFLMQVKLNDVVPPALYAAVAEVLAWAYGVDGSIEDKKLPASVSTQLP